MHRDDTRSIVDVGSGRINRLNDRFVKRLLANPQSKSILIDFINDALLWSGEDAVTDLEITTGELVQDFARMKLSLLDVSATLGDGRTVDIEVQIVNRHDFRKRAPYYWAMRHVTKLREQMVYHQIKGTILICLLAFDLLDEEKGYRNEYAIRNGESGNRLCDDLQIVYLELPKFLRQVESPHTGLERWLLYFSNEEGEKMSRVAEVDRDISRAMSFEKLFWADEKERQLYFAVQKQLMDEISNERTFEYMLDEAGEKLFRAEEKLMQTEDKLMQAEEKASKANRDLALRMLHKGYSAEEIADVTLLPLETIRALSS